MAIYSIWMVNEIILIGKSIKAFGVLLDGRCYINVHAFVRYAVLGMCVSTEGVLCFG